MLCTVFLFKSVELYDAVNERDMRAAENVCRKANGNLDFSRALTFAVENELPEMYDMLMKYGGQIKIRNTLIHYFIYKRNYAFCEKLIADGFDINTRNTEGNLPLHIAAETDNVRIIELLIKNKAKVSVKNNAKQTALHVAAQNGCFNAFRILREYDNDKSADTIYVENLPWYS